MKRSDRRYVQYINQTYRRTGSLWEERSRSYLTREEPYVLGSLRLKEQVVKALGRWVLGHSDRQKKTIANATDDLLDAHRL